MKLYFLLLSVLVFSWLGAQANLEIEIRELESAAGDILLELLDENEQTLKAIVQPLDSATCRIGIAGLEAGTYAVKFFHDSNSNGQMDFNWLNIPTEGFGFSNDAYGRFMPKKFKEWLFELKGDTAIIMTPKYLHFP